MKDKRTSDAQLRASKAWDDKNKEKKKKIIKKSHCKSYILTMADELDLDQVQEWIEERKKDLKKL